MTTILEQYHARHRKSEELAQQARELFPDGVTHDTRYVTPFGITVTHAQGPRKWDVDGNEYIDYVMGHGSLLLGHAHPAVTAAVAEQVGRGTHLGGNHALEADWARLVVQLIPSAEKVRFTSSGTEATLLAARLARAYTERNGHHQVPGALPRLERLHDGRLGPRERGHPGGDLREYARPSAQRHIPGGEGLPGQRRHRRRHPGAHRRPHGHAADLPRVPPEAQGGHPAGTALCSSSTRW